MVGLNWLSWLDKVIDDLGVSVPTRVDETIETLLEVVQLLHVVLDAGEARQEMFFEVGDKHTWRVVLRECPKDHICLLQVDWVTKDF